MAAVGADTVVPRLRESDADMPARPWIDDFSPSYMKRVMPLMPRQGDRAPWVHTQRYSEDRKLLGREPIDDDVLQFARSTDRVTAGS